MKYRLFVPSQAAGTSVVFFDLFNASGSGCELQVLSVLPVVSGAVAVTGVIGVDLFLTKTSAIGTGGTAATAEGSSLTAATISSQDHTQPINSLVTARLTPTGGATAAGVLSSRCVFVEETNAGTYVPPADLVGTGVVTLREGRGIRVVQNAVASVGNIGFDVVFDVYARGGA
jgi:hypothetical protein